MDCWLLHLCVVFSTNVSKSKSIQLTIRRELKLHMWEAETSRCFSSWHISLLEYTALSSAILEWMKNSLLLYLFFISASFLIYFTWQQPPSSHSALACISTKILHLMFPHTAPHWSGCYGHGPCGAPTCPAPKTPCLHTHFYFVYFP